MNGNKLLFGTVLLSTQVKQSWLVSLEWPVIFMEHHGILIKPGMWKIIKLLSVEHYDNVLLLCIE